MKSLRFLDRRAGYSLASLGLLLGIVAPTVLPAFASGDVLSSRSVTLSDSTANAASVNYTAQFTVATALPVGGGFIVQFCDSTTGPLLGQDCDEPGGMDLSSADVGDVAIDTGSGFNPASSTGTVTSANETSSSTNDNFVKWVSGTGDGLNIGDKLKVEITGIHNPTASGTFYARIYTYTDSTNFGTFTDSTGTDTGTIADNGSVALSTTSQIGVNAYVLESMTFCVSKGDVGNTTTATAVSSQGAPSEDCGTHESSCTPVADVVPDGCVVAPSMTLGEKNGNVIALSSSALDIGQVYAQLSTNAAGGALVSLKSDATSCGGLYRNGSTSNCDIVPQTTGGSGFSAGAAKFGLVVGSAAAAPLAAGGAGTGTGTIAANGSYDATHYYADYASDNTTGITSTYGSPLFHSTGTVNNMNVPVTFGASITNTTPAGSYGANFNMIATGTF